ncbi:MAG: DUF2723 domain-containing protein [Balneolaceae bacterium]
MTTRLNPSHVIKNRIIGGFSFLTALIVYTLTVSPTTSFWDPGEYIAIAHTLQIAHPPGSPFFALWGRLFSMFSPPEWVALSVNMISVLTSSFTIFLLYLITIRLLAEWQGEPESWNPSQQLAGYGGALVGALTFIFTHTHWFNAVEAEMYAPSMFFTALVVWIALLWAKDHEEPKADRWLILIAYLFGLGIGVHLLNLLTIFFVALIIYFKRWTFSIRSFFIMGGVTVLVFLSIYPVTIIWIPSIADNMQHMTYGMLGAGGYFAIVGGLLVLAIRYTHKHSMRLANLIMIGFAVILIGYSSYALILIRSIAEPPIDENDPSTIEAFVSYLNRDQYGQSPLLIGSTYDNETGRINRDEESFLPRRHSAQPRHMEYYSQFDSDWDYFWHYQVNHMYLRYFAWNFIGRDSDIQDAGWYSGFRESPHRENPANSAYYFLPLLVGLIGLYWHVRQDPHRAFAVFALFIMTGLAIIFYLNQTPFEPRERDYAYVGSFFAFSIWIGIGATALLSRIPSHLPSTRWAQRGLLGALLFALPVWMAMENWPSHDRSNNYVARDYAWNLLQSVDKNAILFTNGDNDTFPLWYLQEVERVRTDVRVVNLSLLNTAWYIKQLRDRTTHESLPLPIRLTDADIDEMTSALSLHEPDTLSIPVDRAWLSNVFTDEITPETIEDPVLSNQVAMATPYSIPVDSLDSSVEWYLEGRYAGRGADGNDRFYLQVQDLMVLEILQNNRWVRPVYFANTVSRDGQLDLQPYFQYEGKAFRVVPKERSVGEFGYLDPDVHQQRLERFRFEDWNHPDLYLDENIRRMITNYRYAFTQLADARLGQGRADDAAEWLARGEDLIPFRLENRNWTLPALYAYRYARAGAFERASDLTSLVQERILYWMQVDLDRLEKVELDLMRAEGELERARQQARTSTAREIQQELNRLDRRIEQQMNDLSFSVSQLTILQRVWFLSEHSERAEELAQTVEQMTQGRIQLPSGREENARQIERYNLGI